ncbi:MAG: serine/threonine-protein kinase [Isosphaeraceae bacterium]
MATETNSAAEDKIGGFRFVRTIHPGATSLVMEVVQESTGKRFALKQLSPTRAEDPSERRLFEFEAKLGMELKHPNIIHVHEYIRDPIQPYFIMDLFPSYHLKLPIARPSVYPMPVTQLHRIMEQAASALAYMHDKGWVHRDIKPENILVNKSGEVRVIDYALAMKPYTGLKKLFRKRAPVQGTPSYMAPEQIRGEPPTPAADIYSFGITCYELACGRPPFRGDSQNELLNKHIKERPTPLTAYNKKITTEYNDLILKMIAKKPADRLGSLHEFLSKFSRVRIYKDDPDPAAGRVSGAL